MQSPNEDGQSTSECGDEHTMKHLLVCPILPQHLLMKTWKSSTPELDAAHSIWLELCVVTRDEEELSFYGFQNHGVSCYIVADEWRSHPHLLCMQNDIPIFIIRLHVYTTITWFDDFNINIHNRSHSDVFGFF